MSKRQFALNDNLTFGKYKGISIKEVVQEDATYIEWALDEVDFFELDDQASEIYDKAIDKYYDGGMK